VRLSVSECVCCVQSFSLLPVSLLFCFFSSLSFSRSLSCEYDGQLLKGTRGRERSEELARAEREREREMEDGKIGKRVLTGLVRHRVVAESK
jgi:hypothetical protein